MSINNDQELLDFITRAIRIIGGSLIAGVLVFLGIAFAIDPTGAAGRGSAVLARLEALSGPGQKPEDNAAARAQAAPQPEARPAPVGEILTWIALGFAAMMLPLSFWVPGRIADQNRRSIAAGTWSPPTREGMNAQAAATPFSPEALESDTGKLLMVYQTQFIVGAAMIEGVAFLATVAYLLGKDPVALGLAVLLLLAMAARFPTRLRVASWVDRQQESLILDRQAAS